MYLWTGKFNLSPDLYMSTGRNTNPLPRPVAIYSTCKCMSDDRYPYIAFAWKPNSWSYSFIEVSGHNLESSQTWGFCIDFLNQREGGVWFSIRIFSFLIYRNCKRFREFEEIAISRQSCRGECEYQGGKLLRLLSGFRQRIRPVVYLRQSQFLRCKMILLILLEFIHRRWMFPFVYL